jgi:branched-subunit amino acid aminotransferase/4-amino-4-deoxychorismate lyase
MNQTYETTAPCPRTALRLSVAGPCHFDAHLGRLKAGAAYLGQNVDWLDAAALDLKAWLELEIPGKEGSLRLRLHIEQRRLTAEIGPLPQTPLPYRLVPMDHPMAPRHGDAATGHKGLCGPWSDQVIISAKEAGGHDALLTWPDGTIAETAIASIGLEAEDAFILPPLRGRVASLTETHDLPDWASHRGLQIKHEPIRMEQIRFGQVWCLNALRGIWPGTVI